MSINFKTCLFGGFDREDVISYIEKTARESQEQLHDLTAQAETLQRENEAMSRELENLRQIAEGAQAVSEKYEALLSQADQLSVRAQKLEAENKDLRVQTAEYQAMKDHIAEIEISAHRRTQEFRAAAIEQLHGIVAQQRERFSVQRGQFADLHTGMRRSLQAAQDALGDLDFSGFEQVAQELADLDRKLDE